MPFVDECRVFLTAGRGGNGSVSMHSEPYKPHGGPDGGTVETAFYFTQPPPLRPPEPGEPPSPAAIGGRRPRGPFSAIRRTSKRRHMRENVRYLTTQSGSKKPQIDAWVSEIADRTRG
jgi:hypothetical protein